MAERNIMIMEMLYLTGARCNEVLALRVGDVQNQITGDIQDTIRLPTTKNKKPHKLFVSIPLKKLLKAYIRKQEMGSEQYLFPSQRHPTKCVSTSAMLKCLNSAMAETGISNISTHGLRKTFAYACRRAGADLEVIREMLNHSSLEMTQRYFQASDWEAKKVVNNLVF
jgi:integrase